MIIYYSIYLGTVIELILYSYLRSLTRILELSQSISSTAYHTCIQSMFFILLIYWCVYFFNGNFVPQIFWLKKKWDKYFKVKKKWLSILETSLVWFDYERNNDQILGRLHQTIFLGTILPENYLHARIRRISCDDLISVGLSDAWRKAVIIFVCNAKCRLELIMKQW